MTEGIEIFFDYEGKRYTVKNCSIYNVHAENVLIDSDVEITLRGKLKSILPVTSSWKELITGGI
jgi:hypothetical protein